MLFLSLSMLLQNLDDLPDIIVNYLDKNLISVSIMGRKDDDGKSSQEIEVILSFTDNKFGNLINAKVRICIL